MKNISSIFEQPKDSIACRNQREVMTYGELYQRSENLAKELVNRGAKRVLIYGQKECSMIVAMLACLRAGIAFIPCNTGLPHDRIAGMTKESNADLALCAIGRGFSGSNTIPKENITKLSMNPPTTDVELPTELSPDTPAYIIFTSGSTGQPKGVIATRANLENFIGWLNETVSLKKPGTVLNFALLSIDMAMIDIFFALTNGHTVVLTENDLKETHKGLFRHMQTVNPNMMVMTPSLAEYCLELKSFNRKLLPELNIIYMTGEALHRKTPKTLHERFPDLTIINAYGPTEGTCNVCASVITDDMGDGPQPIGEIDKGATEILILDDDGNPAQEGEITLVGPSVTAGYTDGNEGGYCEIDGKRAYRTGDIGRVEDGKLYWSARKDSQVKVGGYRLECSDVEINMCRIPGIIACGAIVQYGHLVAYVTLDKDVRMTPGQIRAAAREFLPQFMIPGIVRILDTMPVDASGRLDRRRLTEQ